MLYAITTLFLCQLAGELLVQVAEPGGALVRCRHAVPVRRPAVARRRARGAWARPRATLLRNLVLLFIPAVTGVMLHFERVGREWLPFLGRGHLRARPSPK